MLLARYPEHSPKRPQEYIIPIVTLRPVVPLLPCLFCTPVLSRVVLRVCVCPFSRTPNPTTQPVAKKEEFYGNDEKGQSTELVCPLGEPTDTCVPQPDTFYPICCHQQRRRSRDSHLLHCSRVGQGGCAPPLLWCLRRSKYCRWWCADTSQCCLCSHAAAARALVFSHLLSCPVTPMFFSCCRVFDPWLCCEGRIGRIIKLDQDVQSVSKEATALIGKAMVSQPATEF